MLKANSANYWDYITGNVYNTRPTANYGTSINASNNAFPAYTSILAGGSIATDCYWVVVNINSGGVAALAKDTLVTLGLDPSGGTAYTDWIPNLLCSDSATYTLNGGGCWYRFPLFVKAGSQIAAKASCNNASPGSVRVAIWLYGRPSRPEMLVYGQSVEAAGAVTASSRGTLVTPGTTNEGAWTSLGTLARKCIYFQLGMGVNSSNMQALCYHLDLATGDGTNNKLILSDARVETTSNELLELDQPPGFCEVPAGATIYGRIQCHGSPDANTSMIAYGVRA